MRVQLGDDVETDKRDEKSSEDKTTLEASIFWGFRTCSRKQTWLTSWILNVQYYCV